MNIIRASLVLTCLCLVGPVRGASAATPAGPKPDATKAAATAKAKEQVPVVLGVEIERPNHEFLGLAVVDNHFVLSFYNAKKTKVPANVQRATLRWPVKYQPNDERTVLNLSADGMTLTSSTTVRPPRRFKVFMGLFTASSESAVETYSIDFHE